MTGRDYSSPTYNLQLWSSTDGAWSWQEETVFPGTGVLGAVSLDDYIYVVDTDWYIWRYNLQTKGWTKKSQLPSTQRGFHCMYVLNQKIYIGLGTDTNSLLRYDPVWDN